MPRRTAGGGGGGAFSAVVLHCDGQSVLPWRTGLLVLRKVIGSLQNGAAVPLEYMRFPARRIVSQASMP